MPRTAAQSQAHLLASLPDTPDGLIRGRIVGLWAAYGGLTWAAREAQVRLDALTLYLAACPDHAAWVQVLMDDALAQLQRLRASYAPAVGQLTTTAPISPPAGSWVDANDPAYSGSPYRRRWGGGW